MVDRYNCDGYDYGLGDNAFVLYADYAALEAEAEKLRAFVKAFDEWHRCENIPGSNYDAMMAAREAITS